MPRSVHLSTVPWPVNTSTTIRPQQSISSCVIGRGASGWVGKNHQLFKIDGAPNSCDVYFTY